MNTNTVAFTHTDLSWIHIVWTMVMVSELYTPTNAQLLSPFEQLCVYVAVSVAVSQLVHSHARIILRDQTKSQLITDTKDYRGKRHMLCVQYCTSDMCFPCIRTVENNEANSCTPHLVSHTLRWCLGGRGHCSSIFSSAAFSDGGEDVFGRRLSRTARESDTMEHIVPSDPTYVFAR